MNDTGVGGSGTIEPERMRKLALYDAIRSPTDNITLQLIVQAPERDTVLCKASSMGFVCEHLCSARIKVN